MEKYEFTPIAYVTNNRDDLRDDDWGEVVSEIRLRDDLSSELFKGLESFSHVEIVFIFHRNQADQKIPDCRHPRNNQDWPKMGLLAQRSSYHPNPIGLSTAKILNVDGGTLRVQGLDAVDGSPVLDIKPIYREFMPQDSKQPPWVFELLREYWKKK